jgi:hypothetical protein
MPAPIDTPLFRNNVTSAVAADIGVGASTVTLVGGDGVKFPAPDIYEYFVLLIERVSDGQREIMHCTGRTADTLTVDRAQEGTSALAFEVGDLVSMPITAGLLEFLRDN